MSVPHLCPIAADDAGIERPEMRNDLGHVEHEFALN